MRKQWTTLFAVVMVLVIITAGCGKKYEAQSPAPTPTPAAQGGATPAPTPTPTPSEPATNGKQWSNPPAMQIDTDKTYLAEVDTSKGKFTIELFAKDAPNTVNSFVFLAKEGFYDNVIFHRIIETFMIQTGDPTGTGTGGPGYKYADELPSKVGYEPGIVAMANSGKDTNGSQFFICTGENSKGLKNDYTIFGKVIEGMENVTVIAKTPVERNPMTGESSTPSEKVTINAIKITEK
ncbi:peptidylprolyl isomerase [Paenibacillus albiflavus]|uniref:Peptidyl-prolyl cis-trans isomerase n=1 Tax=Paenibacillus albiflavus TaxID=2545760 RepID=A0A4R4ENN7_9BACL|nr:peptidylprolyl isomerase [Paenibacillus albiflavus]TCZ81060.1 peptidylprolyl isomerase [Paenibacillus albiflavus]